MALSGRTRYLVLLGVLLSTILSVALDIPVLRPLVGFLFLTFTPGLLFLEILRLNQLQWAERLLLALGLSISFVIFFGLFLNTVYPTFGNRAPLTPNSLLVSFAVAAVLLGVWGYVRNHSSCFDVTAIFHLSNREKLFLLVPAFFPLLSIGGMYVMNTTGDNVFVMTLLLLIPAYAVVVVVKREAFSARLYTPVLLLIGISVTLLFGLRSNHVIGADVHTEYYLFQQTLQNGQWRILLGGSLDSCLSISIFPAVYQALLAVDAEMLFKTLYPVLLSGAPVAVYLVAAEYVGGRNAFLAALFFTAQPLFQWVAYSPRTSTAILFFALAVMAMFRRGLGVLASRLFVLIFVVGCVVSHYTTSYIFLFMLLLAWLGKPIVSSAICRGRGVDQVDGSYTESVLTGPTSKGVGAHRPQPVSAGHVTVGLVAILFAAIFIWHGNVAGGTFAGGVSFVASSLRRLGDFLLAEARTDFVQGALGSGLGARMIPSQIDWAVSWLTITFIAIGVLTAVVWHWRTLVSSRLRLDEGRPASVRNLDADFVYLAVACSSILVAQVALPHVVAGYDFGRSMLQMAVILSPFFVIGGIWLAGIVHSERGSLVVLAVLVPFFLCTSGAMYQLFGVPQALTLNSEGQQYDNMFISDTESNAAKWLGRYMLPGSSVYGDQYSHLRLRSQGGISSSYAESLIERHEPTDGGYLFLRHTAIAGGRVLDREGQWHDLGEYDMEFVLRSRVYANHGSEVWGS